MASYFNPATHLTLLPSDVRQANEMGDVAEAAERDVIAAYTQRKPHNADGWRSEFPDGLEVNTTLDLFVYLRGYRVDADDPDTDPDLKVALRDTVADVLAWRLRQLKRGDNTVESESTVDGKSRTYREMTANVWPPNWDWRLRNRFDTRERY